MKHVPILRGAPVAFALLSLPFAVGSCRSTCPDEAVIAIGTNAYTDARLGWWRDARFGLFVHWGLYAIPAGQWEGRTDHGEWIRDTARIPIERYETLKASWNPTRFDPDAWARAARDAGMGYVVITTKHHDGFCLFDSQATDWDVMSTPSRRDVMKDMAAACRREGLVPCWYHSIMDWHHPDYLPRRGWESDRPATGADFDRYERYLDAQVTELLTHYGKIGVMWFDGEWESTWNHARGKRLYDLCRRLQPDVIVNNRVDVGRGGMSGMTTADGACGDFGTPEQEVPATGMPGVDWESCMTMNGHWGFNARDTDFKSVRELERTLVDVCSKGGNLLLNVGPTAEGEIPAPCLERLAAIGKWMRVNGEAIHGTQASPVGAPGWGRVTWKRDGADSRVYLHVFDWPADGQLDVSELGNEIATAHLLAEPTRELRVESDAGAYRIQVPKKAPDPDVSVVELVLKGAPMVYARPKIEAASDIFVKSIEVTFLASSSGVDVRYTVDGSQPTITSALADGPLRIAATTTVTARSFHGGRAVAEGVARTFTRVRPEKAVHVADPRDGLVYLVTPGDRTSVAEPRSLSFDIGDDTDMVRVGEELKEHVAATLELPADYRAREQVMLTFLGFVRVPADDVYEFALTSDDGAVLHVGERFTCDDDGLHGAREVRGTVALESGWHALRLDWFNRTGAAVLDVRMGRLGQPLETIRAADLAHDELDAGEEPAGRK